MTKTLLPLVAALVAIAAAPAQAATIVSHTVSQDVASVRAYWTAERMRAAVPRERARGGGPVERAKPSGGAATSWSTLRVDWLTAPPELRAHGKVFFTERGTNYVCSGTLVESGDPSATSVVWTAGHCVNDGEGTAPGDFATNWQFVPAYNSGTDYGRWNARSLHTTASYAAPGDEYGQDLGAATMEPGLRTTVGTARAVDTDGPTLAQGTRVKSYGYPAAGKYNGQSMYVCDSYVSRYDTSASPKTYGIPCGMTGGSSGGGWVVGNEVVSVNSYGYGSLKNVMFGPQHGQSAAALLAAAD